MSEFPEIDRAIALLANRKFNDAKIPSEILQEIEDYLITDNECPPPIEIDGIRYYFKDNATKGVIIEWPESEGERVLIGIGKNYVIYPAVIGPPSNTNARWRDEQVGIYGPHGRKIYDDIDLGPK